MLAYWGAASFFAAMQIMLKLTMLLSSQVLGMDLDELPPVTVSQYVSKDDCRGVEVQKLGERAS